MVNYFVISLYHFQTEADVGVIEKIQLVNFMCHRRLDIELCPNINFVLGRNGSMSTAVCMYVCMCVAGLSDKPHFIFRLWVLVQVVLSCCKISVITQ